MTKLRLVGFRSRKPPRHLRAKSDLPVIFLTSKQEVIDEVFTLKMGADDFIRKPFSHPLLVGRVKAVLWLWIWLVGEGSLPTSKQVARREMRNFLVACWYARISLQAWGDLKNERIEKGRSGRCSQ